MSRAGATGRGVGGAAGTEAGLAVRAPHYTWGWLLVLVGILVGVGLSARFRGYRSCRWTGYLGRSLGGCYVIFASFQQ